MGRYVLGVIKCLISPHLLPRLRVFSCCPCGRPLPCWQLFRIRVDCVGKVCCSVSPCVAYELVALALAPVSCVSRTVRLFSISRVLTDSRGCARSRIAPIAGSACNLSLLRFSSRMTFRRSSSVTGRRCFIASRASRLEHRVRPPSPRAVRIVYTSRLAISRILAFLLVAMFFGFLK